MPQGTIKSYDAERRSGLLVDDARQEFAYDFESFRNTGHRLFRIGQRVSYSVEGEGERARIRDLRILTVH